MALIRSCAGKSDALSIVEFWPVQSPPISLTLTAREPSGCSSDSLISVTPGELVVIPRRKFPFRFRRLAIIGGRMWDQRQRRVKGRQGVRLRRTRTLYATKAMAR